MHLNDEIRNALHVYLRLEETVYLELAEVVRNNQPLARATVDSVVRIYCAQKIADAVYDGSRKE